jgi:hypothetical protein
MTKGRYKDKSLGSAERVILAVSNVIGLACKEEELEN